MFPNDQPGIQLESCVTKKLNVFAKLVDNQLSVIFWNPDDEGKLMFKEKDPTFSSNGLFYCKFIASVMKVRFL